jgi:hypothetical protein
MIFEQKGAANSDLLLFPDRENSLANRPKGVGVALNDPSADIEQLAQRARHHSNPSRRCRRG